MQGEIIKVSKKGAFDYYYQLIIIVEPPPLTQLKYNKEQRKGFEASIALGKVEIKYLSKNGGE